MTIKRSLLLLLALATLALPSLGCGGGPPLDVKIQLLDPAMLKEIRFLDIALFTAAVSCSDVNETNYRSAQEPFSSARMSSSARGESVIGVKFEAEDYKSGGSEGNRIEKIIEALGDKDKLASTNGGNGIRLNLFVLGIAVKSVGGKDTKTPVAKGCSQVVLKRAHTSSVTVTLNPL